MNAKNFNDPKKLPDASDGCGYGKPPKDKQFKKGKSGNPSGRPKGRQTFKSLSRVLRDTALNEVGGHVNGKWQKMIKLQAVVEVQFAKALKGDTGSAKLVIDLIHKHLPLHLSLEELMEGRSAFEGTEEDVAKFKNAMLVADMEDRKERDDAPVL